MKYETAAEIVFLIDTSGSMYRNKIAAVNAILVECMEVIRNHISRYNAGVRVSYMTFNSKAAPLQQIEDVMGRGFPGFEVKAEDGFYPVTRFEALYDGILLAAGKRQQENIGFVLITDGKAVDTGEYAEKLERAGNSEFFRNADRIAACAGNEEAAFNEDLLAFTGYRADRIFPLNHLTNEVDALCRRLLERTAASDSRNDVYDAIFGKN